VDEISLSLKRLRGGDLGGRGRASSLGTVEVMVRKSQDTGTSLHGGHFPSEGNLVCGGKGGARIPGTSIDEWRALVVGHLSARDSIKGTLREGSFTGEPKR
jgi:hypothetical protein